MDFELVHQLHQRMFYDCHPNAQEGVDRWNFTRPYLQVNSPPLNDVNIQLDNKQMWQQFHAETTEMIITKLGRRMFPSVQISVNGLDRQTRYCVLMEIIPTSKRRHKYIGSSESVQQCQSGKSSGSRHIGWTTAGAAEPQPPVDRRIYLHPDSPATGAHWMQQPINFTKLKLTNNGIDHHNNVVLTSMHKYIPRIWIIRAPDTINTINNLFTQPCASFTFAETEFVAVTAYQNENITKLKIDNNPFAKGFRETGQSRCKRKFDDSHCGRIRDDEEGGNVSSSDSESHERDTKRVMSDTSSRDDSGASSSGGITPPPPPPPQSTIQEVHHHRNDRPKLHRPWATPPSSSPLALAVSNIAARVYPPSNIMFQSFVPPSNHTATDFPHLPIFFHSMEQRTLNAALCFSSYQYYQPSTLHTTKILR